MITTPRRYKFVVKDTDRHGNDRYYLRRPGYPKVRLVEALGSDAFDAEYRRAIEAKPAKAIAKPAMGVVLPESVLAACIAYYGSAAFKTLDKRTQHVRRLILGHLCDDHGHKPFKALEARHMIRWRDAKADKPEAANALLKAMRAVYKHAASINLVPVNLAMLVPYIQTGGDGFHTWSIEEVRQFEERWPVGTMARLSLALLLFTGQRRSDVVLFGKQHVRAGQLHFVQVKNQRRNPVRLVLPIVPELARIIGATPNQGLTFLTNEHGRAFTPDTFGNRFRAWSRAAGLEHCTPHGLRKAAAVRLAELGATAHELKAVLGHRTLKEVERYTRQAEQAGLAATAFNRLPAMPGAVEVSHSSAGTPEWDETASQPLVSEEVLEWMVPRAGIEPATLRFSVACSTN